MKLTYFFALILVLFLFPGPALALDDHFEKGREAIDKQDYDEAITRFTAVIQNAGWRRTARRIDPISRRCSAGRSA